MLSSAPKPNGFKPLDANTDVADAKTPTVTTPALVARLLRESIRPYLWWIVSALICMGLVASTTGAVAWLLGPVVDRVFVDKNQAMLWPLGGTVVIVYLIKGMANYGQTTLMSYVGQRIIADTQCRLYDHLSRMELAFFQRHPSGTLISRFTTDINMMRAAVSNALTAFGKDTLTLIILIGVMFFRDWQLAAVSFFIFPIAVLPIVRLGRRIRKVTVNTQEEMGLFTTLLGQTFQGARVVKAYGMEGYEEKRVRGLTENIFQLVFRAARVRALASPIMETLGGLATAVVIVYGGFRVIDGATTSGAFVSFLGALLLAYEPMKRLANLNASLQEGLAGAQRLFVLMDQDPEIVDRADAKALPVTGGAIQFDGVNFAYRADRPALDDISFAVPAGQMVALVGASGAGKSTIMNLIPRFYDVDGGRISIDGVDIRETTLASLRGALALVSQDITLFDDTVRANIAYGRADASENEIIAAATAAAAHEFITDLPEGYDTYVGEQGTKLSGGQRQRLAIARAMLKDAPILLLDEATSALDTESERQVQAALQELTKNRTSLVIAHRLSTVINADLIHVIDGGRLVESGTHTALLAEKGVYARLHAMQFGDQAKSGMPSRAVAAEA